jgi:hypothetical protein
MSTSPPPLVLGFVGENANDVLESSTAYVTRLLAARGIEAHSIDLRAADWNDRLRSFVTSRPILFGFGYAGVGSVLKNGAQSFWTAFQTPFLSLMYDHPFYNIANHTVDSPYVANCYFIPDFAEVQKNFVKSPQPCFVFHDPIESSAQPPQAEWKNRPIRYLFVKSGGDPAKLDAAIAALDAPERALFHECLKTLQASSDLAITDLVSMRARFMNFGRPFNDGTFARIVLLLDRYLRDWRSRQLVEWLKHKPAVIVGGGWDTVDKKGVAAQFLPARPFHDVTAMYQDSRFAFNTNPYFRDACHERVIMALIAGAVAVSDRNQFSDRNFAHLGNFAGFDWGDVNWREKLDARLGEIEKSGGNFDPAIAKNHVAALFPAERFVTDMLDAAAEIRRRVGK